MSLVSSGNRRDIVTNRLFGEFVKFAIEISYPTINGKTTKELQFSKK